MKYRTLFISLSLATALPAAVMAQPRAMSPDTYGDPTQGAFGDRNQGRFGNPSEGYFSSYRYVVPFPERDAQAKRASELESPYIVLERPETRRTDRQSDDESNGTQPTNQLGN